MRLVPRCDAHREALLDSVDVKGVEPADSVVRGTSFGRENKRKNHCCTSSGYERVPFGTTLS